MLGLTLTPGLNPNTGDVHHLSFFDSFFIVTYTSTTIGYGEIPYPFTVEQRMYLAISIYIIVFLWFYLLSSFADIFKQNGFKELINKYKLSKHIYKKDTIIIYLDNEKIPNFLFNNRFSHINFLLLEKSKNKISHLELPNNIFSYDFQNKPFNISDLFDFEPNFTFFIYDETLSLSKEIREILSIKFPNINWLNITHGHTKEDFSLAETIDHNTISALYLEDLFKDRISMDNNNLYKSLFLNYLIDKRSRTINLLKRIDFSLQNDFKFFYVDKLLSEKDIQNNYIYLLDSDYEIDNLNNTINIEKKLHEPNYLIITNLQKSRASHFMTINNPYIYFFNSLDIFSDILYSRISNDKRLNDLILDIESNNVNISYVIHQLLNFEEEVFIYKNEINRKNTPNIYKNLQKLTYKEVFDNNILVRVKDRNNKLKTINDIIEEGDEIFFLISHTSFIKIEELLRNPNFVIKD